MRDHITIYRVAEPTAGVRQTEEALALHARYPEGPRDAEALFFDTHGGPYIVTKRRHDPIELYRFPLPLQPGAAVVLERIRQLFPKPDNELDRVTAATATPDGRWVGIRTYRQLFLYRASELTAAGAAEPIVVDLAPLRESQGEALVLADDGSVWVSTEAEDARMLPAWSRLSCTLPLE